MPIIFLARNKKKKKFNFFIIFSPLVYNYFVMLEKRNYKKRDKMNEIKIIIKDDQVGVPYTNREEKAYFEEMVNKNVEKLLAEETYEKINKEEKISRLKRFLGVGAISFHGTYGNIINSRSSITISKNSIDKIVKRKQCYIVHNYLGTRKHIKLWDER